jgi:hypothetical protein
MGPQIKRVFMEVNNPSPVKTGQIPFPNFPSFRNQPSQAFFTRWDFVYFTVKIAMNPFHQFIGVVAYSRAVEKIVVSDY